MLRRSLVLFAVVMCGCAPTSPGTGSEADGGAGPECSATKACGSSQTCLPTGVCAASCTNDSQCSGGKCSAAGGCIAPTGCGGSLDCTAGTVCGDSVCVAPCTATSCSAGERCTSSGRCLPSIHDAGTTLPTDAGVSIFIDGPSCGGELYGATAVQANFLIVLDHSGSMKEVVGGAPKWNTAVAAIRSVTAQHQDKIRFGLQMFSAANPACFAGKVDVPVAEAQAGAISSALPAEADGRNTPIGGALKIAATNEGIRDTTRSNNVLLITDGEENCNGKPVNEVKALFASNVKTYVVGFGGQVDASMLSQMATQGGTARPSTTKYYQADDPTKLAAAFSAIANGALACDLKLVVPPPDTARIYVYVNGVLQSRDPSRKNGWDYLAEGNRVALFGGTCTVLTEKPNADVSIVYGCPDGTLVPGGTGTICLTDSQCGSNTCTGGLCVDPARPDGSTCTTNGDCASGQCTDGICETPTGGKPVGAACGQNTDCASMVCLGGFCTSPIN